MSKPARHPTLRREIGLTGALMMGLGSIIGTGVFVSIGIAAGIAGPAVIIAIALAAIVAAFNALNSAQLAASHPVSGGTYEYGYHYLRPALGFSAGWMFLCAKTASAATAALGFAGYLLNFVGVSGHGRPLLVGVALATVLALTVVVATGLRLSNRVNIAIVSITLLALASFVAAGVPLLIGRGIPRLFDPAAIPEGAAFVPSLLHATALMFVAYTGYGRIATLGEEVHDPRVTIPRAIVLALGISALLYISVAAVALAAVGAADLAGATRAEAAPLEFAARALPIPGLRVLVAVGAMTAMLGVLLNLLLGLSRVLLAMGRRGDMPGRLARLDRSRTTPTAAVLVVAPLILAHTLNGNVKTTWSFSAFTVLIYYAITNLAALFIPAADRLYPRWLAVAGLVACLFLAFWVDPVIWLAGSLLILAGLAWHGAAVRIQLNRRDAEIT